jgi:hypothetical protein
VSRAPSAAFAWIATAQSGFMVALRTACFAHPRDDVDHLETFKTVGLPKAMRMTTKATTFAKIRCFLRAAFRRGWIKEALVDKVTTVKGGVRPEGTVYR